MPENPDKTYICTYCHKEFTTMLYLDEHIALEHKKDRQNKSQSPAGSKPSIEPADHKETTELPPGAKQVTR
jgi:hypothetical protein